MPKRKQLFSGLLRHLGSPLGAARNLFSPGEAEAAELPVAAPAPQQQLTEEEVDRLAEREKGLSLRAKVAEREKREGYLRYFGHASWKDFKEAKDLEKAKRAQEQLALPLHQRTGFMGDPRPREEIERDWAEFASTGKISKKPDPHIEKRQRIGELKEAMTLRNTALDYEADIANAVTEIQQLKEMVQMQRNIAMRIGISDKENYNKALGVANATSNKLSKLLSGVKEWERKAKQNHQLADAWGEEYQNKWGVSSGAEQPAPPPVDYNKIVAEIIRHLPSGVAGPEQTISYTRRPPDTGAGFDYPQVAGGQILTPGQQEPEYDPRADFRAQEAAGPPQPFSPATEQKIMDIVQQQITRATRTPPETGIPSPLSRPSIPLVGLGQQTISSKQRSPAEQKALTVEQRAAALNIGMGDLQYTASQRNMTVEQILDNLESRKRQ
jgi:hypothetical protein